MACADISAYEVPAYINILLSPDTPLDYHINVGRSNETMQRFGVDKWMLVARSQVFWSMMHESNLKHEKEFTITDLDPCTFQHFLVYLYGFDNTSSLAFKDSVSLLNAAEKYDVPDLKTKLGNVVTSQVNSDNVFVVLRNALVCEKLPKLWETVTEIIQYETEDIVSNFEFLHSKKEIVLHILQQDSLSITEVEVWKAALNWARFHGTSEEEMTSPECLRKTLLPMLKHIRLCTLSKEELFREVFPSRLLTGDEVGYLCSSIAQQEPSVGLDFLCNNLEQRNYLSPSDFEKSFQVKNEDNSFHLNSEITIKIKDYDVKLRSFVFQTNKRKSTTSLETTTYQFDCSIKITCLSDPSETSTEITSKKHVEFDKEHVVQLKNTKLKTNKEYKIEFKFSTEQRSFYKSSQSKEELGDIVVSLVTQNINNRYYIVNFKSLNYRVIKDE